MRLEANRVRFGGHESFPLRYGWLAKGLREFRKDSNVFESPDATVTLGIGKNMVSSVRHWLKASRLLQEPRGRELLLNERARYLLLGDQYLEDEGTIWLIHWLLATNARDATSIYWFFNHFHKVDYTADEVASALRDYVRQNVETRVAESTLKSDASLLLRMYCRSDMTTLTHMEDALDSPLSTLDLHERLDSKSYRGIPKDRPELPTEIFGISILETFEHADVDHLTIRDLMYSDSRHCAPGSVFRMTEDGLVTKLEDLCSLFPGKLEINQTAGIHQLYRLADVSTTSVLAKYYGLPDKIA